MWLRTMAINVVSFEVQDKDQESDDENNEIQDTDVKLLEPEINDLLEEIEYKTNNRTNFAGILDHVNNSHSNSNDDIKLPYPDMPTKKRPIVSEEQKYVANKIFEKFKSNCLPEIEKSKYKYFTINIFLPYFKSLGKFL